MGNQNKRPLGMVLAHGISTCVIYPLCYYVARYRVGVVRSNLEKCFPDKSKSERRQIERAFYHHFADMVVEMLYGARMGKELMAKHFVNHQLQEIADETHAHGGIIVTFGHMFNWEWICDYGNQMGDYGIIVGGFYKHLSSSFFNRLILRIRRKRNLCMIDNRVALRSMVKFYKEHQPTFYGMVADQRPEPNGLSYPTTLLGQPVGMITGPETLGRRFGFPIYYGHLSIVKRGFYEVKVEKIYDPDTEKELPENVVTQRFTELLEQDIKADPSNWLWSHNRFWRPEE